MKINVIGGGTWGTTLACLLSKKADVSIWQRSVEKTTDFAKTKQHPNLKDFTIPDNISVNRKKPGERRKVMVIFGNCHFQEIQRNLQEF